MDWIHILKCPISGQDLAELQEDALANLNSAILMGEIRVDQIAGIQLPILGALSTSDNRFIYPIVDGIVVLIADLVLSKHIDVLSNEVDKDKLLVRNFYDQKGWFANDQGDYEDALIYEDLREVAKEYIDKCHQRVSQYLPGSGKYILDAASGPIQYDAYLQYSAGFDYRVCVDFSFQALLEARKKLRNKGIYVLADMTNMPFKDNVIDAFISLNTIYHIPKNQQITAMKELYRLLKPGRSGVIVYDWFKHSLWMNAALLPFRAVEFLSNRIRSFLSTVSGTAGPSKRLYFYAHRLDFLKKNLPEFKLRVWRTVSVPFLRYYIHTSLNGKQWLEKLYELEEKHPEKCGRNGEYPMFVFEKPVD